MAGIRFKAVKRGNMKQIARAEDLKHKNEIRGRSLTMRALVYVTRCTIICAFVPSGAYGTTVTTSEKIR